MRLFVTRSLVAVLVLCAWLASASIQANVPADIEFGSATIVMNKKSYELEHAKTMRQRARGLMFRDSLCDDCGMLFTFYAPRVASIWMKNTFIPLDLAYVDENGIITGIFQLKPHDLNSVSSQKPVAYAIEMNQGWFARHNITVGDRVFIKDTSSP